MTESPKSEFNMKELIEKLIRSGGEGIDSYFTEVKTHLSVTGTKALAHCYFLNLDGNGRPRTGDLANFIAMNILDYSIPRSEINEARAKNIKHNTEKYTQELAQKARALFTTVETTGEGGEMLLYVLVQEILKLPQLICKMPLKTNSESHYQGVDGVHVSVDINSVGEEILSLYWGESKLHSSFSKAVSECVKSVKKLLLSEDGSGSDANRDLQLIQDNLDAVDEKLENAIVRYLDKKNPLFNKVNFKSVCLIGFDYDKYPTIPNSGMTISALKKEVEDKMSSWTKSVAKQIGNHTNLNTFDIHVFLIPFPDVSKFREAFLAELGLKKDHEPSK